MTAAKLETLTLAYNDIQDRLYEIDKSWKNNLIFYGIPIDSNQEDEDPYATEDKVGAQLKHNNTICKTNFSMRNDYFRIYIDF